MNLKTLRKELEDKNTDLSQEQYKKYAGLEYSEDKMNRYSEEIENISKEALDEFKREEIPKSLYQALVSNSIASKSTELSNKIYKVRSDEIKEEIDGEEVTVTNWRTWSFKHLLKHSKRKEVFDSFLEQSQKVKPLLKKSFNLSKNTYNEYGLDVLKTYLEMEGLEKEELMDLVTSSAKRASKPFSNLSEEISQETIGREMKYYDDLYIYRSSIYKPFDSTFQDIDFKKKMLDIFREMGFNLSDIAIDSERRKGKTPSPMCMSIRVPDDVRVLYQETTPFGDFTSFCHEMGHALHGSNIDEELTYEDKYVIPMGIAELFSTLFETLATDRLFLKEELSLKEGEIDEIQRKKRFMDLYFLTFYGANSQMKIEYWDKDYSMEEATERYGELYKKYVGKDMPGEYWMLHHVVSMYDIYSPSYLIAKVRKSELLEKIKREYKERWWTSEEAGDYIRSLMSKGKEVPLEGFSNMDEDKYLKEVLKS